MKAQDVIGAGESAIAIYTDGTRLVIGENGDGQTGNWVVRRDIDVDRVILYLPTANGAEVHVGAFTGVIAEAGEGRRVLGFSELKHVGHTDANWSEFAGKGQNPIRYLRH